MSTASSTAYTAIPSASPTTGSVPSAWYSKPANAATSGFAPSGTPPYWGCPTAGAGRPMTLPPSCPSKKAGMKNLATQAGNKKDETATRQVREHPQRTARLSRPRGRTAPARLGVFCRQPNLYCEQHHQPQFELRRPPDL